MTGKALPSDLIARAFIDACTLEVRTLKPGNVHIYADGHGMKVSDFETSARVSATHIANPNLSTGARILSAVLATFAAVNTNTNLGILLLCAPLAVAADHPAGRSKTLEDSLKSVLASFTRTDTEDVFRAIARATPGGLGKAETGDVRNDPPPSMTLIDAMTLAAPRDLIAAEYTRNFEQIFTLTRRDFTPRLVQGWSPEDALARIYLQILAQTADSHVARKSGATKAEAVRARAAALEKQIFASDSTRPSDPEPHRALLAFDSDLKSERVNPGSLADLMAAVAFTHNLKALQQTAQS